MFAKLKTYDLLFGVKNAGFLSVRVKLPYSAGLLVVRTDSKLSKHIEFM